MSIASKRMERNDRGRDFVVGDVHGCFRTLEELVAKVEFVEGRDRLFSVGDLIDRGPNSQEALEWLMHKRIDGTVAGNHEYMFGAYLAQPQERMAYEGWWREVERDDKLKWLWTALISHMPFAMTIETAHGDVGIIHAGPMYRNWIRTIGDLEQGRNEAMETALLGGYEGAGAQWRGKRGTQVRGLRALFTGHRITKEIVHDGPWWSIDTGAGTPGGKLSMVQIDDRDLVSTTIQMHRSEEKKPKASEA